MSVEPVVVGGSDALDIDDGAKAYRALTDLAEAQMLELAAKAHQRPTATTSYAFPR